MRRRILALGAASTVTILLLTALSCDDGGDGVTLGEVTRADVVELVDAPATVVAAAAATLTAAADGTVDELRVAPGDDVTAGQVVAVVDSPAAQRRLERASEALAAAEQATPAGGGGSALVATQAATDEAAFAAFEAAREAARYIADPAVREAMLAQVDASQEQYEVVASSARAAALAAEQGLAVLQQAVTATATAQRLQAQQAYDLAKTTVDALTVRAPFDGVVQLGGVPGGEAPADLESLLAQGTEAVPDGPPPGVDTAVAAGDQVGAGTALVTVVDVSELGVLAEVDETDVLLVEAGIGAEVELDAAPGAGYPAEVTAVDLLPTPSARGGVAYGVRLSIDEGSWPGGAAAPPPRPGMSAVAHLAVAEATGALAVPASAILRLDGQDVVWAVRDGRATRTEVTLGVQGPELVEVSSGLRAGDRIVVSGADRVSEGEQLP